ncbi:hypothetical protein [Klebsiella pneumoniae]|uniref:hypothetical protein n=1 Tax=Klebsiella pneumoniae TaxID=573 RepID=UPI0018878369|nr:hypothetical protein [Klebsiella pneumoniae]MBF2808681.1 hypothetical protein [Klebsiella pneumoniae]QPP67494.1 hypothetical protein I5M59_25420 [Klebsiella pneumoniae]
MLMKGMFWRLWHRRMVSGLAQLCGVATAQPVTDKHGAWREYALFVGAAFQRMLADDKPAVKRLHAFFDDAAIRGCGVMSPSIIIRVWLDEGGGVARLEAVSALKHGQATADLQRILMERPIGKRPPTGMPMPLLVRLWLTYEE